MSSDNAAMAKNTSVNVMAPELEDITVYGDVRLRQQRRKRRKMLITELFIDYTKHTSLHGLRYVAEMGLSTFEKLFWVITFVISVSLCSFLIKNVYVKWRSSPVIVTINERLISVSEVPFPSVTICPQIKSMTTIYNLTEKIERVAKMKNNGSLHYEPDEFNMFADVVLVCDYLEFANDSLESNYRNFTNASIIEHIGFVAPNASYTLAFCTWHNNDKLCETMFEKVYTAEGLCFNMNGLAVEEMFRDTVQSDYKYSEAKQLTKGWSIEESYSDTETDPFPRRGSENGATPDLEVVLTSRTEDEDVLCNGVNSGYKIYIQHPADFPQSSMYYYAALNGQVSSLAISSQALSTSDTLSEYAPEIRQCFFPKDRYLRYFKIYTATNCRVECLSNYTFRQCNCVGYYMPHDNGSQICAENKYECMDDAHDNMTKKELQLELLQSSDGCRCLPACDSVEYDADILKTDFHLGRVLKKSGFAGEFPPSTKFSKVEVYFKKARFVSMRRSELFGITDFLANIGGLLGVFLGFSFLSLMEILYYITLRLGCLLKKDLKDENKIELSNDKVHTQH